MKSRFRCLHRSGGSLQYTPEKCAKIVISSMYLHNLCVKRGLPVPEEMVDEDDHPEEPHGGEHARGRGRAVRQEIINNF